jgi:hypothetical protein
MIQTFFNTDGTGLTAIITVIVDGDHVDPDSWPITNDPAIVLSSHPAASKTVTAIDTGVFKVVWSSLSPALAHGDVVFIAVDGDISATAWTTWQIPVQVVHLPAKSSDVTTALEDMDLDKALIAQGAERAVNVDVSHRVHSHVYDMQANTITASALAADAGAEIYAAFGTGSNLTALATQASVNVIDGIVDTILIDTNDLQTNQGAWLTATGFATVNPDNAGIAAIQGKTDQLTFTVANQVDSNALTGGGGASAEDVRIEMDANSTKLADILEDTNELQANQGSWLTATSVTVSDKTGFSIAGTINTLDELDTAQDVQHAATQSTLSTISTNVSTLLDRVTTTVVTLWSNLTAMISGSGVTAAFTETALENGTNAGEVTLSEAQQQAIIDSTVNGVTAHRSRIQNAVYGSYTLTAGDTWDQTFDVATAGATRVLVAIKKKITDTDDQSLLLMDDVTGLLRVNKLAAADAAEGEVIADGTTVRAVVDSAATLLIPPGTYSVYVKYLSASRDSTPEYKGELKVEAAGIRIVS